MLQHSKYNGEIVAGSLLICESRTIAGLLLDGANEKKWHQKIVIENILQKKSPKSSIRQARLIRNRLSLMNAELFYTGQGLKLFGKLEEINYYRAFQLIAH
jgi:hypothetical protein